MALFKKKQEEEVKAETKTAVIDDQVERKSVIRVKICDRNQGLEVTEGVSFVRVKSKRYNLLIMADYLPIIGEIDGNIHYRTKDKEYERNGIHGYFMHKNNEFSLMIKSSDDFVSEQEEMDE